MLVGYRIPFQENQAKEGLTFRVILEHFPTLHKTKWCINKIEIN